MPPPSVTHRPPRPGSPSHSPSLSPSHSPSPSHNPAVSPIVVPVPIPGAHYGNPPHHQSPSPEYHHPQDHFNTLRFSICIHLPSPSSKATLDSDQQPPRPKHHDDDDDDDLVLQPLELCFHDSFDPDPDRPVSLHFDRHDRAVILLEPPTLPTPTPPYYVVEYEPVHIGPAGQHLQEEQQKHAPRRSVVSWALLVAVAVAVAAIAGFAAAQYLAPPSPTWSKSKSTWPSPETPKPIHDDIPAASCAPDKVSHTAHTLPVLDELLAIINEWAAIPETLLELGRPSGLSFYNDSIEDADLLRYFTKTGHGHGTDTDGPLDTLVALSSQLVSAMLVAFPGDLSLPHLRPERRIMSDIVGSSSAVQCTWGIYLEAMAGERWIPSIVRDLDRTARRLRAAAGRQDEARDAFFASPDDFDPSRRRLSSNTANDAPPIVANESSTLSLVLGSYTHTLQQHQRHHGESDYCGFFRRCQSESDIYDIYIVKYHAICNLPRLPDAPSTANLDPLVEFLEQWRHLQVERSDHDDVVYSSAQAAKDERCGASRAPRLLLLAPQIAAFAADLDRLLDLADFHLGQAAPSSPDPSPTTTTTAFWSRYFSNGRKTPSQKAVDRVRSFATQIATIRNSVIWPHELAAVQAVKAVRSLCARTERLESHIHVLGRRQQQQQQEQQQQSGGWVEVSFIDDTPSLAVAEDGCVRVRSSHRAILRHGLLPPLGAQADAVDSLGARLNATAHKMSSGLHRLHTAQRKAQDQDNLSEGIIPGIPIDFDAETLDEEMDEAEREAAKEAARRRATSIMAGMAPRPPV